MAIDQARLNRIASNPTSVGRLELSPMPKLPAKLAQIAGAEDAQRYEREWKVIFGQLTSKIKEIQDALRAVK